MLKHSFDITAKQAILQEDHKLVQKDLWVSAI